MIPEEKDLNKLKLKQLKNAFAIPISEKSSSPFGVLLVYNFDD
jgi:hypothetical protein